MKKIRNFQLESKIKRMKRNKWYVDILKTHKCAHCGNTDYRTFDWHHLDPNQKEGRISRLLQTSSTIKILAEMKKCIILCKNCHAIVHYHERGKKRGKKLSGPVLDI